jgi:hypothetical protein
MVQDADDEVQESMEDFDDPSESQQRQTGTDARIGGVNRQTAEQIVEEQRQSEQTAEDFRGIGNILPAAPNSGFGRFTGFDETAEQRETEQRFTDLEREGSAAVTSAIDEGFEALTGSEPTGEAADATRSFGGALGGAVGGAGNLLVDANNAIGFVATGNQVEGAPSSPVTRAGQVGDAVVGAGVDFVDERVRIDESAQFNDESLRFDEPVVEVEPNKQGELAGEVTFTAASTVAGTAAGSRFGTGSDLSGKALKKGASGVNRGLNFFDRKLSESRSSGLLSDTRGQQQLTGPPSGGSRGSGTSDGGFEPDADLLDDSLTQNQDFLRDLSRREQQAQEDFGGAGPNRGDGGGGVGNDPTPGGELGGGGRGPILDADAVDRRNRGGGTTDQTARDIADEQLDKESQSPFFRDEEVTGDDTARDIADAQLDAESQLKLFKTGRGTGIGVGVGSTGVGQDTGQDVDSDVTSLFDSQLDTQTRGDTRTDQNTNTDQDDDITNRTNPEKRLDTETRVETGSRTESRLRTEAESAARFETVVNVDTETESRIDEIDLTDADNGDRRRRRRSGEIDTGEFEQDIFTPGEILSGEAGLDDL